MPTTNRPLRDAVFADNRLLLRQMEKLLLVAARAHKFFGKNSKTFFGLGERKFEKHMRDTAQLLDFLIQSAGGIREFEHLLELTKQIYPNWFDAYAVIDGLLHGAKEGGVE